MSIVKKLVSDTAAYGLSSILARLINYLFGFVLVKYITPAEYGVYAKFYAYAGFIMVLLTHGMETAFFRFYNKEGSSKFVFGSTFSSMLVASLFFLLICICFGAPISDWVQEPGKSVYIWSFAGIMFFDTLSSLPFALLRARSRPFLFALLKIFNIFITILSTTLFLYLASQQNYLSAVVYYLKQNKVCSIFFGNFIGSVATFLFFVPLILKNISRPNFFLYKKILPYAFPIMLVGFAGMINEMLDRVLLEHLLPFDIQSNKIQLGIYSFNYKIAMLMSLFIQAYRFAVEPFFFSQAQKENAKNIYASTMLYFVAVGSFIFLIISLFTPVLFKFLLHLDSSRFLPYSSGMSIIPILLAANLCLGIYFNLSTWYKITDKTHFGAIIAFVGALLTIFLNFLLVPRLGFMGSAWATLLCYASMVFMGWFFEKKYFPISYEYKKIGLLLGLSIILFIPSRFFYYLPLSLYLLVSTICLVLYMFVVYFVLNKKKLNTFKIFF